MASISSELCELRVKLEMTGRVTTNRLRQQTNSQSDRQTDRQTDITEGWDTNCSLIKEGVEDVVRLLSRFPRLLVAKDQINPLV